MRDLSIHGGKVRSTPHGVRNVYGSRFPDTLSPWCLRVLVVKKIPN